MLTASRPDRKDNVRWHRGKLLIMGIFLLVAFYVVLCRLENDHVTDGAALLAPGDNAADERLLPAPTCARRQV